MNNDNPAAPPDQNQLLAKQVNLLLQREKELTEAQLSLEHAMERNVSLQHVGQGLIICQSMDEGLDLTTKALVADMSFEKSFIALKGSHGVTVASTCGYTKDEQNRLATFDQPALAKIFEELAQMKGGILVTTPEQRERFGVDALNILGMHTFLIAPLLDAGVAVGCLMAGYSENNAAMYGETLWLGDRDAVWFSSLANQVSSMATNAKLITSLRERTDELHAEQARLHASIESLSLGFMLANTQGQIVTKNQAFDTMLSLQSGSVKTAADVANFFPAIDLVAGIAKVQQERTKYIIKSADAGSRILRILLTPVSESGTDDILGVVVLFEDITEEKLLDRSKDEFLSIASHELRTPLTAIKGNTSMILNYYAEVLKDPGLKELIDDIHEASGRLIEIVNDFLDASRIEQGKMTYRKEAFALDEVIERIFYEMGEVVKQKGLYLKLNAEAMTLQRLPLAYGDKDRTKQIVYNLLGNGVKYTDTGGIFVDISVQGQFLKVVVRDTGRGIPPETQKLLFRKFQQAGSSILTRDTTRGTGLGLYISKLMAEGMGGRLNLEYSEQGKGSAFSVSLPIAVPNNAPL
jgi:signal transduction histidine kinase